VLYVDLQQELELRRTLASAYPRATSARMEADELRRRDLEDSVDSAGLTELTEGRSERGRRRFRLVPGLDL
jgi:hypothetical protein